MNTKSLILTSDSYKSFHGAMLPEGTEYIQSYLESRNGAMYPYTLFFGLQYILKEWLEGEVIKTEDIDEAEELMNEHFKFNSIKWDRTKWDYIVDVHGGKLPLSIKALPEGRRIRTSNALCTVINTDKNCAWLGGNLETLLQNVWYTSTVATRSNYIVNIIKKYFEETVDDDMQWLADYYLHDFGARACSGAEMMGLGGMSHLVNAKGTDTVRGMVFAKKYYNAQNEGLGYSVPASEHLIGTSLGPEREFEVTKRLIELFPNGILSVVSDSYDIVQAVEAYCTFLKEQILSRNGKFVVRPDSPRFEGDTPEEQILWIVQECEKGFGSKVNSKGFKDLDPHVGCIYGDSLTENNIGSALETLKQNGYSALSSVYGCGSYLLSKLNRDTQRQAFKGCALYRSGEWHDIYKSPRDKTKQSKRGLLKVVTTKGAHGTVYDTVSASDERPDELVEVFRNGKILVEYSFDKVRKNATIPAM